MINPLIQPQNGIFIQKIKNKLINALWVK